ncbi:polysaccharide lyase family 7 protein [Metapseudomonas furukawaii]
MIDLGDWNLTIPEGQPAITITSPQLQAGYRSAYFAPDGSRVVFWVPVTGTSTQLSDYPRTELREAHSDGKVYNWSQAGLPAYMQATLEVLQVPSNGKVIIGQIHAADSPYPLLKLEYQWVNGVGYVNLTLRDKPTSPSAPVVMTYKSMPMGMPFNYRIDVGKTGALKVDIGGLVYQGKVSSAWAKKSFYFKAGAYIPDNTGPSTEGALVVFHDLRTGHGGTP